MSQNFLVLEWLVTYKESIEQHCFVRGLGLLMLKQNIYYLYNKINKKKKRAARSTGNYEMCWRQNFCTFQLPIFQSPEFVWLTTMVQKNLIPHIKQRFTDNAKV